MAVVTGQTGTACRTVQQLLQNVVAGDTTFKIQNPGMLDAVRSQRNRSLVEGLDVQDPNGRTRINQVRYWPPLRTAASGTKLSPCDNATAEAEAFANVTVETVASVVLEMNLDDFLTFCSDFNVTREQLILQKLNQLYVKMDSDLVTYALAVAGRYGDGTSSISATKTLPFINTAGNAANILGEIQMRQELELIESTERPFIVAPGSSLFDTYTKLRQIGCCTDSGIDLSTSPDFDYYRDNRVGTISTNAQRMIVFSPGALQMATAVRNVGIQEQIVENDYAHTTIVDPRYNIQLDLDLKYDDCDRVWRWVFSSRYGFFNLPSNLEPNTSPFYQVNNILLFNASCGAGDVCAS